MIRLALRAFVSPLRPLSFPFSQATYPALPFSPWDPITKKQFNEYFSALPAQVDAECGQIIRELGREKPNISKLTKQLQSYFQKIIDPSFYQQTQIPKSLFPLFSALNLANVDLLSSVKRQLIERTNRAYIDEMQLSRLDIHFYILYDEQFRRGIKQKSKLDQRIMNLMTVVQNNFQRVDFMHYIYLLKVIRQEEKLQSHFTRLAAKMQDSACGMMKRMVRGERVDRQFGRVFSDHFIEEVCRVITIYGPNSDENMQAFYEYITRIHLRRTWDSKDTMFLLFNSLFRSFNYYAKNKEGVHYKSLLLNYIVALIFPNSKTIKEYSESRHCFYFGSSIITYSLYIYAESLASKLVKLGSISYLPRSQVPPKPELPSIFWQLYRLSPEKMNSVSYMDHLLRDLYPEHYLPTKGEVLQTIEPALQTEMRIRVEQALLSLGMDYKSQIKIGGRFIDFLVEDRIVLQIDGIHHYQLNSMNQTDKSQMRNAYLILKGYQMIIINIYEYNVARELEELKELLKCKIETAKANDAVFLI